jgi:hypothetical protein
MLPDGHTEKLPDPNALKSKSERAPVTEHRAD